MKRIIILALLASATWAVDFTQISTEELTNMRGNISVNDQAAFRAEMQKRMQMMTPEQRQQFMQNRRGGQSQGMNNNKRSNSKGRQNRPTFATYDLNSDSKITQKEFYDAQANRMTQKANEGKMMRNAQNAPTFTSIDANNDGIVTQAEFSTHQTNRMNSNMGKRGQNKGQGRGMNSAQITQ